MVEFLNATQSLGQIQRILTQANNEIVIISPYIKISDDLVSRLMVAGNNRNIKITMICREKDLSPEQRSRLEETPNLRLHFNERVHAKCFYNDESMVITSLNLYESSLGENREMGVLLRNDLESDKSAFKEAKREAEFIISESEANMTRPNTSVHEKQQKTIKNNEPKYNIETKPKKENKPENSLLKNISEIFGLSNNGSEGHCIRCGNKISFNVDAPYCADCFRTWVKYKDVTYKEKHCHKCGQESETSKKYPLCSQCYKKSK